MRSPFNINRKWVKNSIILLSLSLERGASLEAVSDDSMCGIIRGNTYLYPIPFYNPYSVLFHPAGKHGPHGHVVVAFNFHPSATQDPGYHTLQLD